MKKTLVALAALAVVGAASAQSTVTLYGKVDLTVQNATQKTTGAATAAGNVGMQVNAAGLSGSRWGMKGSEDLGGGLKANFQLESGFSQDSGASGQGGLLFGRQAYVGLSGGFGSISGGRQYSPVDSVWGTYDGQGYSTNSAMGYAWNGGMHADAGRINNSLLYTTPAMGGLTVQAMWAPGEAKVPTTGQGAGSYTSVWLNYAAGPLGVGLGWEGNKATSATDLAGTTVSNVTLGIQYDLGVAKLSGGFERSSSSANSSSDEGTMIALVMPVGGMTLSLGHASENTTNAAGAKGKQSGLGGQLVYPLSKRTNLYADFLNGQKTDAATQAVTKNTIFGVGMRHDF